MLSSKAVFSSYDEQNSSQYHRNSTWEFGVSYLVPKMRLASRFQIQDVPRLLQRLQQCQSRPDLKAFQALMQSLSQLFLLRDGFLQLVPELEVRRISTSLTSIHCLYAKHTARFLAHQRHKYPLPVCRTYCKNLSSPASQVSIACMQNILK